MVRKSKSCLRPARRSTGVKAPRSQAAKNPPTYSPLQVAAKNGNVEEISLLLKSGWSVDEVFHIECCSYTAEKLRRLEGRKIPHFCTTPLQLASEFSHPAAVSLLLQKGASIEARDGRGRTALHIASRNGNGAVVSLLIQAGAKIDLKGEQGETALSAAIYSGNQEVVLILLEQGAPVEDADVSGNTPLHIAVLEEEESIVMLLLQKGAGIDTQDSSGCTALLHAVNMENEALVSLLLEWGASLRIEDSKGNSPLRAMSLQFLKKLLKKHGIKNNGTVGQLRERLECKRSIKILKRENTATIKSNVLISLEESSVQKGAVKQTWECQHCRFQNDWSQYACRICESPSGKKEQKPSIISVVDSDDDSYDSTREKKRKHSVLSDVQDLNTFNILHRNPRILSNTKFHKYQTHEGPDFTKLEVFAKMGSTTFDKLSPQLSSTEHNNSEFAGSANANPKNTATEKKQQGEKPTGASFGIRLIEVVPELLNKSSISLLDKNELCQLEKMLKDALNEIEAAKEHSRIKDEACCICWEHKKSVILLPCKHLCLCGKCSAANPGLKTCPLCCAHVAEKMVICS